jgi:hypothetical protein
MELSLNNGEVVYDAIYSSPLDGITQPIVIIASLEALQMTQLKLVFPPGDPSSLLFDWTPKARSPAS